MLFIFQCLGQWFKKVELGEMMLLAYHLSELYCEIVLKGVQSLGRALFYPLMCTRKYTHKTDWYKFPGTNPRKNILKASKAAAPAVCYPAHGPSYFGCGRMRHALP